MCSEVMTISGAQHLVRGEPTISSGGRLVQLFLNIFHLWARISVVPYTIWLLRTVFLWRFLWGFLWLCFWNHTWCICKMLWLQTWSLNSSSEFYCWIAVKLITCDHTAEWLIPIKNVWYCITYVVNKLIAECCKSVVYMASSNPLLSSVYFFHYLS